MKPATRLKILSGTALLCGIILLFSCHKKTDPYAKYSIQDMNGNHLWHGRFVSKDTAYNLPDTNIVITVTSSNSITIGGKQMTIENSSSNDTVTFSPPPVICDCANYVVFYYHTNSIKWIQRSFSSGYDMITTYTTP